MKAHLFSSVTMCSCLSQRTTWGYPHKMLMMCCLLQGSVINLRTSPHFPSLFLQGSSDEQMEGREWLGLPNFTPHILSSCVNSLISRWAAYQSYCSAKLAVLMVVPSGYYVLCLWGSFWKQGSSICCSSYLTLDLKKERYILALAKQMDS